MTNDQGKKYANIAMMNMTKKYAKIREVWKKKRTINPYSTPINGFYNTYESRSYEKKNSKSDGWGLI